MKCLTFQQSLLGELKHLLRVMPHDQTTSTNPHLLKTYNFSILLHQGVKLPHVLVKTNHIQTREMICKIISISLHLTPETAL
jgi:hypothetical protein